MRLALLLALVACVVGSEASLSAAPPNVLLITSDDLGLQLGCYGDKVIRTPNVDALAQRGRVFENAYVAQASCSPSRSAMFTGIYPHANGQYGLVNGGFELHEPLRKQTIPAVLKAAGYRTGILGKLHVAPEPSFPFDVRLRENTRDVQLAAGAAGAFMRGGDKPFFLMANFADPHVQGRSPRPPMEAFATQVKGVPDKPLKVGEVPVFPFQGLETAEQVERITQYYNAVMRMDAAVGLLLAELAKAGHADDTLILFVGDHGPPFLRGKTSCYEGGVRVPMLAVWPGVLKAGERSPALVSTVDLLPTIVDACGLQMPAGVQGRSLRHTVEQKEHREFLATEFHYHGGAPFFPRRSIRDARYKLIHNLRAGQAKPTSGIDGDAALAQSRQDPKTPKRVKEAFERAADPPEFELYDLQSDPWEFEDLSSQPAHAKTLERMKEALMKWRQETADPLLTKEGLDKMAAMENKTRPPPAGRPRAR